ncbi:MAG TPA: hypothetical protein VKJ45_12470, partial [Blastocatellia bacterium]|nr:hypothetical protein [Blastocatellia bacterium]
SDPVSQPFNSSARESAPFAEIAAPDSIQAVTAKSILHLSHLYSLWLAFSLSRSGFPFGTAPHWGHARAGPVTTSSITVTAGGCTLVARPSLSRSTV